ncbi:ABC transporter ATP-binding protein [Brucella gallinifaecis]|uniref:ABC transporter ATP-binding protein n=1 Tax=Brucella gallinifaecis TaxID=215590 RepID=UPI00235E3885|nr:ABC transporter ATP-binding protein [Brucella gallinifaecis]
MSKHQTSVFHDPSPVDRLLRPVKGLLWFAMIAAAIGQVLTIIPLAGIAEIARLLLSAQTPHTSISSILIASVTALFLGSILITAGELLGHLADNRLTQQLRFAIVDQLLRLPLGWFARNASGQVKQLLQDDVATLHELTAHYYTTKARCIAATTAPVLYLLWVDWRLSIICLLPFPLYYLLFGLLKKSISADRMASFVAGQNQINAAVIEFIQGIPVMKTFAAAGRSSEAYANAVNGFVQAFTGFTRPLVNPMANANAVIAPISIIGVVLAAGSLFLINGWINPVTILPFMLMTPAISSPFMLFGFLRHSVAAATSAAQRIVTLLDTSLMQEPSTTEASVPVGHKVCFEELSFDYDSQQLALSDITLALEPGTVTALVGPSGAGKSTLARLLLRFDDPSQGCVTLGGVDLRHMTRNQICQNIGFVLQDVQLMNASISQNIALGRPSASFEEIEAAARAANIHDRILELPRGYNSVIGEDAVLSGGEAQRVSIARAILLDAPVLVMDEATAAVDVLSESKIQTALSSFIKGRTVLIIAHRLDTIMMADQIVVMDQGKIVEVGDHMKLLIQNGLYAQLWHAGKYSTEYRK